MSAGAPDRVAMVGESVMMSELRELIAIAAASELSVFIHGETGVGKELVAQALHAESRRAHGPLVAVNSCAPSDSLFEDFLFGHVRGAFTGATHDRAGCLAEADGGTIFLDEISGLGLEGQARLLRAVETHRYRPVGAPRDRFSDFRVVAASNEDVDALVSVGRFRSDLAFRLRGIDIVVPPLRARREDIALLAEHFATLLPTREQGRTRLTVDALRVLEGSTWPGNVRQLRQVVERAVAFGRGASVIGSAEVERALATSRAGSAAVASTTATNDANDFSRRRLTEVLERNGWDTAAAAAELGVTRKTVYARLQRLAIAIPDRHQRRVRDLTTPRAAERHAIHRRGVTVPGESGESAMTVRDNGALGQRLTH